MEEILIYIYTITLMPAVAGFMGLYQLLFAQIFLGAHLLGLIALIVFASKKIKAFILWTFSIAPLFLWGSLLLSSHKLLDTGNNLACYAQGFPFRVFTIPCPPFGSNLVPLHMWLPFYLNYALWIALSAIIVLILLKKNIKLSQKLLVILLTFSAWINFVNAGIMLIHFD